MADNTNIEKTIVIESADHSAKIVLDWDDGQWYISDITSTNAGGESSTKNNNTTPTANTGVKLAVWDKSYKYSEKDLVSFDGQIFVSHQNVNQGNGPLEGTFWWKKLVDLSTVNAITLEGKTLNEVMRVVLGGNTIADYYKKTETDNIILAYFNNVNAKTLGDWSLQNIKDAYISLVAASEISVKAYVVDYLDNEGIKSYQQSLVDLFNLAIASDDINKL